VKGEQEYRYITASDMTWRAFRGIWKMEWLFVGIGKKAARDRWDSPEALTHAMLTAAMQS